MADKWRTFVSLMSTETRIPSSPYIICPRIALKPASNIPHAFSFISSFVGVGQIVPLNTVLMKYIQVCIHNYSYRALLYNITIDLKLKLNYCEIPFGSSSCSKCASTLTPRSRFVSSFGIHIMKKRILNIE